MVAGSLPAMPGSPIGVLILAMASALGVGAPELQESQTDTVDVTVIVGRDFNQGAAG